MTSDFTAIEQLTEDQEGIPFPTKIRRPDFRSSGPKRLMPQLQIKAPTISRWGKKMAVVVDERFWSSLGRITEVHHLSNCDIIWFVVHYGRSDEAVLPSFHVALKSTYKCTLDRAAEGLTGGTPVSLRVF